MIIIIKKKLIRIGNSKGIIIPSEFIKNKTNGYFLKERKGKITLFPSKHTKLEKKLKKLNSYPFKIVTEYNKKFKKEELLIKIGENNINKLITGERIRSKFDIAIFVSQFIILKEKKEYEEKAILNNEYLKTLCKHLDISLHKVAYETEISLENRDFGILSKKCRNYKKVKNPFKINTLRVINAKSRRDIIKLKEKVEKHGEAYIPAFKKRINLKNELLFIYLKGNPNDNFFGLATLEKTVDVEDIPLKFKKCEVFKKYREYKTFIKTTKIVETNIPFANVTAESGKKLTERGILKPTIKIKYKGNNKKVKELLKTNL